MRLSNFDRQLTALASAGLSDHAIADLIALAPAVQRSAEAQCNGTFPNGSEWSPEHPSEKRLLARIERVRALLPKGWLIVITGDPRGYTLRVRNKRLQGNTWGGTNLGADFGIEGRR